MCTKGKLVYFKTWESQGFDPLTRQNPFSAQNKTGIEQGMTFWVSKEECDEPNSRQSCPKTNLFLANLNDTEAPRQRSRISKEGLRSLKYLSLCSKYTEKSGPRTTLRPQRTPSLKSFIFQTAQLSVVKREVVSVIIRDPALQEEFILVKGWPAKSFGRMTKT